MNMIQKIDLTIIKPGIGIDKYHWESDDDVLKILGVLKFHRGYRANLKVDHNEGVYLRKGDLIGAFKAFTEK